MNHHHVRCKGHDFKEYKSCHQIGRKENADRCSERQKSKEIVAVAVPVMGKVFFREHRRAQPHKPRNTAIQRPEAVCLKAQPSENPGQYDCQRISAGNEKKNDDQQEQFYGSRRIRKQVAVVFAFSADAKGNRGGQHRQKRNERK